MSLAIHHLDCQYTARRDGDAVRARFDSAVAMHLANALRDRSGALPGGDGALCFIERMEVATVLRDDTDTHALAGRWAEALCRGVAQRIRAGEGVVIFRSRAEYLASWVQELLSGSAVSWFYEELARDGRSTADQIAAALIEDGDAGRDALLEIHQRACLHDLLALLGETRIEHVVSLCVLPSSPDVFNAATLQRWARMLGQVIAASRFQPSRHLASDTLVLYAGVLQAAPGLGPDVNLARCILRLLELASVSGGALLAAIREGNQAAIRAVVPTIDAARFVAAMMQAVAPATLAALIESLQPAAIDVIERTVITEHAGAFLLAAPAIAIDLHGQFEPLARTPALPFYLTLLQCLGGSNATRTATDRGLVAFCGLDALPSAEALTAEVGGWALPQGDDPPPPRQDWLTLAAQDGVLEHVPAADRALTPFSAALLAAFARRLGAFGDSSPEYLYRNFLSGRGVVTVSPRRFSVRLLTCPMQVVLRMAGFGSEPIALPWLGGTMLELAFE